MLLLLLLQNRLWKKQQKIAMFYQRHFNLFVQCLGSSSTIISMWAVTAVVWKNYIVVIAQKETWRQFFNFICSGIHGQCCCCSHDIYTENKLQTQSLILHDTTISLFFFAFFDAWFSILFQLGAWTENHSNEIT